jgi:phosphatidylserine/phosphatidylglycerophosphate/cardiolipin synthase-like enzyme
VLEDTDNTALGQLVTKAVAANDNKNGVLLLDSELDAFVGSLNLDPRSIIENTGIRSIIDSTEIGAHIYPRYFFVLAMTVIREIIAR